MPYSLRNKPENLRNKQWEISDKEYRIEQQGGCGKSGLVTVFWIDRGKNWVYNGKQ